MISDRGSPVFRLYITVPSPSSGVPSTHPSDNPSLQPSALPSFNTQAPSLSPSVSLVSSVAPTGQPSVSLSRLYHLRIAPVSLLPSRLQEICIILIGLMIAKFVRMMEVRFQYYSAWNDSIVLLSNPHTMQLIRNIYYKSNEITTRTIPRKNAAKTTSGDEFNSAWVTRSLCTIATDPSVTKKSSLKIGSRNSLQAHRRAQVCSIPSESVAWPNFTTIWKDALRLV